jgi:alginate O-acetyltransferase complex protein AlgI
MLFNSIEFALFFPIVCALYFTLGRRSQTPLLLISSCVFYMAFIPVYILILGLTIVIDYFAGLYIERVADRNRKPLLIVSIVATCLVLFVFKYFAFFTGTFAGMAGFIGWQFDNPTLNIILPIGLSFHTFQSLSYVIEVYRGHQPAERNFITYAAYVMFFPQLVAGPIERPQNLLHQFNSVHDFDYHRVTSGLKRMAWGFFKKLVVADRLALYVNDVYATPQAFNGLQLTLATVFFAYQIYCDFSGYSDIAIGSARVLGFRLMENFETPYHSTSIAEFWRRWHISLSTWFRDYLYLPLGGNRVSQPRWIANVLVTFGISGLWHGANWTYVVWGLQNGIYLVFGRLTHVARQQLYVAVGIETDNPFRKTVGLLSTFVLTCAAWVVFRAETINDAGYILSHFWQTWDFRQISTPQFLLRQLPVAIAGILVLEAVQLLQNRISIPSVLERMPTMPRWTLYASFLMAVLMFGVYRKAQFIYFQF